MARALGLTNDHIIPFFWQAVSNVILGLGSRNSTNTYSGLSYTLQQ